MANPYEIDWQPPSLAPGVSLLLDAINKRKADKRADRNAATQEEFARRNIEREAHRDYYERKKFEADQRREDDEVIKSAKIMADQGDLAGAQGLLSRHGIHANPQMGAPTVVPPQVLTPLDVMKMAPQAGEPPPGEPGSPFEGPQAPPEASPPVLPTPVSIMARGYQPTHTGTTVPEEVPEPT